ncbi:MAG: efflux RND transporter periplasmic adaptor subunit [Deltaproteobacteria bacterium]|nr:efflux RND transporter periplasmic adaptor subunit [Deltaproteobacteria bacterium]
MKKSRIIGLLVVIVVVAVVFVFYFRDRGEASRQEYRIGKVTKGKIKAIVSSTGTVNPLNTVRLGSQISGNIKEIYVDFNSEVKKDQVVARIDPAIYAAQVEQAKAQFLKAETALLEKKGDIQVAKAGVQSARASINSAKATLRQNELQYKRLSALVGSETISKSEYDAILAKRDTSKSALEVTEAKLEIARAQLQRVIAQEKGARAQITERKAALHLAEIRLNYCTITSPIDGVVTYRSADVGQTVASTLQAQVLFHIAEDLKKMQVVIDVSEADVGRIKSDQEVEFTVDAYTDRKFKAKVNQVRYYATNVQNVVTYKVVADVRNRDLALRPGMTANVTIVVAEENNVLKIPNAALRFRPLGEIKKASERQQQRQSTNVRDNEQFKKTVEYLSLDAAQVDKYEVIVKAAGAKLKSQLQGVGDDKDRRMAYRTYLTTMGKKLREILREDQAKKLRAYYKILAANRSQMRKKQGRPGKVYILDDDGKPKELKLVIGVTDDNETQVISGTLKEGDGIITGLDFSAQEAGGKSASSIFRMFGRR